ncbi:hypothetical protein PPACK8108_LOCUS5841 [Phakopsora pachyrhizi]|uniref:Uncharacterized protein n=1 Tax=Phakopsora pachyrhizi TaxID=170000 RepID=A0AAV0ATS3_PHAPC|nr:hypothetical protein PPACK8108_LOCUS5841 [Phakopsora pachyrhizi]
MYSFALKSRSAIQGTRRSLALPLSRGDRFQNFSIYQSRSSVAGKVQDAAETLNKKAGEVASKGIEGLESATAKVKSATGTASSQAQNISKDAAREFNSAKESAKGAAKDAQKKASS